MRGDAAVVQLGVPHHRPLPLPLLPPLLAPSLQGLVALWDLWKKTTGTLSLDLSRRKMRGGAPGDSLWRLSAAPATGQPADRRRR